MTFTKPILKNTRDCGTILRGDFLYRMPTSSANNYDNFG